MGNSECLEHVSLDPLLICIAYKIVHDLTHKGKLATPTIIIMSVSDLLYYIPESSDMALILVKMLKALINFIFLSLAPPQWP